MEEMQLFPAPWVDMTRTVQLLFRFFFNIFFVWIIIHMFYYRKSKKLNFYFTFTLISISVFFLTYLLGSGGVKIKLGMALGLFAIFGIIRYRTEQISVREMTYLFVIITLSVINALALHMSFTELCLANVIFVVAIWAFEGVGRLRNVTSKYILYDRVDNIQPELRDKLIEDVKKRTGLDITNIEVGAINYLQDTVMLKVFYRLHKGEYTTSANTMMKLPKEEE
ncbi:MAG: DUF4956 domain-containing protein [Muribaculaceae bacterium]|nr:DUF4956 domain-containing protein [Muribaculaceae bacterium]